MSARTRQTLNDVGGLLLLLVAATFIPFGYGLPYVATFVIAVLAAYPAAVWGKETRTRRLGSGAVSCVAAILGLVAAVQVFGSPSAFESPVSLWIRFYALAASIAILAICFGMSILFFRRARHDPRS